MYKQIKKIVSIFVLAAFISSSIKTVSYAEALVVALPIPGAMISLSQAYEPVLIKGLTVHKDNPFLFDFVVDTGHSPLNTNNEQLKAESDRLIKYFFACLTIPEKDLWVNLSPYEKNKMVPEALGQTALGRDLLAEDYILKQLTASLIYPEKDLGKEFWNRVFTKAQQQFGTTQIPVNTFNKVWIVADKATVYEHGQTAFVVNGHLKVMLEEDYLAMSKHNDVGAGSPGPMAKGGGTPPLQNGNQIGSQIIRDVVIPEIEKEVNQGKNFSTLRQIFNSLILASWYKNNLKEALLNQVYADKSTVTGINVDDPAVKEQIYQQYLKAYKKGVFNYIKEDSMSDGQRIPRKYFSGGFAASPAMLSVTRTLDRAMASKTFPTGQYINVAARADTKSKSNAAMTTATQKVDKKTIQDISALVRTPGKLGARYIDAESIFRGKRRFIYSFIDNNQGKRKIVDTVRFQMEKQQAIIAPAAWNVQGELEGDTVLLYGPLLQPMTWEDLAQKEVTAAHIIFDSQTQGTYVVFASADAAMLRGYTDTNTRVYSAIANVGSVKELARQLPTLLPGQWKYDLITQKNSRIDEIITNLSSDDWVNPENVLADGSSIPAISKASVLDSLKRHTVLDMAILQVTRKGSSQEKFAVIQVGEQFVVFKAKDAAMSTIDQGAGVLEQRGDSVQLPKDIYTLLRIEDYIFRIEQGDRKNGQVHEIVVRRGASPTDGRIGGIFTPKNPEKLEHLQIGVDGSLVYQGIDFNNSLASQAIFDISVSSEGIVTLTSLSARKINYSSDGAMSAKDISEIVVGNGLRGKTIMAVGFFENSRYETVPDDLGNDEWKAQKVLTAKDLMGFLEGMTGQVDGLVINAMQDGIRLQVSLFIEEARRSNPKIHIVVLDYEGERKGYQSLGIDFQPVEDAGFMGDKIAVLLSAHFQEEGGTRIKEIVEKYKTVFDRKNLVVITGGTENAETIERVFGDFQYDKLIVANDVDLMQIVSADGIVIEGDEAYTDAMLAKIREYMPDLPVVVIQDKVLFAEKLDSVYEAIAELGSKITKPKAGHEKPEQEEIREFLGSRTIGVLEDENYDLSDLTEDTLRSYGAKNVVVVQTVEEMETLLRNGQVGGVILDMDILPAPILRALFSEDEDQIIKKLIKEGVLEPATLDDNIAVRLASNNDINEAALRTIFKDDNPDAVWAVVQKFPKKAKQGVDLIETLVRQYSSIPFAPWSGRPEEQMEELQRRGTPSQVANKASATNIKDTVRVMMQQSKERQPAEDAAMANNVGGIDLNTANMGMTIQKDTQGGVKVTFDPAILERIKREGIQSVVPVIINMTPVLDIRPLLGLS